MHGTLKALYSLKMESEPLTNAVTNRICKHMNNDHKDSLAIFAKHYGNHADPKQVELIALEAESMQLDVDGESLRIFFPHLLESAEDAHKTLVAMLKGISSDSN